MLLCANSSTGGESPDLNSTSPDPIERESCFGDYFITDRFNKAVVDSHLDINKLRAEAVAIENMIEVLPLAGQRIGRRREIWRSI